MKGKVPLALFFGALAGWLKVGLLEADGGHLHIGDLSSGASIAIMVAGAVVGMLFVGIFLLRWMQLARSAPTEPPEDDANQDLGINGRDER